MHDRHENMIFLSYAWNEDIYSKEAWYLASDLRDLGLNVVVDRMLMEEQSSRQFHEMMATGLQEATKVIIFLSPKYKYKADKKLGGVATEYKYILRDIEVNTNKYYFVSINSDHEAVMPDFLSGRDIIDIDLSEENPQIRYRDLVARLRDIPLNVFCEVNETPYIPEPRIIERPKLKQEDTVPKQEDTRPIMDSAPPPVKQYEEYAASPKPLAGRRSVDGELSTLRFFESWGTKPRVIVGTIGHAGHGKTTLLAAISMIQRANGYEPKEDSLADNLWLKWESLAHAGRYIEYETDTRHYANVDYRDNADCVKRMIMGAPDIDCALLVVSATEGPMPQTRKQVLLARQAGVRNIVVFLNKVDLVDDVELVELIEIETRELLDSFGYSGDTVPVIWGSALGAMEYMVNGGTNPSSNRNCAAIEKLLKSMDDLSVPVMDQFKPFLMPIENVISIAGRGTVAVGKVQRGTIQVGDTVEFIGLTDEKKSAVVTLIELGRKVLNEAKAGDNIGVMLRPKRNAT